MEKVERAQVKQWNISRKEPLTRYSYYAEAARTAAADDDDDVFQSAATTITQALLSLMGKIVPK